MRPLRLQVAGLNSFKELQEVDFARLCEGNVFGIFGPTGSGKSTIVDAITLALYGTVERASRRTQGIVNQALSEASVLFEWQLGSGEHQKTYRVERKYISKDDSVNCRLARLSELQGEETAVLADKASQVDQTVQEILGLSKDDFTRAVVLPQGRFAEFLTLQGTERRRMLERIFGLEQYGEQLHRLAGERLRTADAVLDNIIHSQALLGAAKAEDVGDAKLLVERSKAQLAEDRQEAREAKSKHEYFGRIRERQQELAQVEEELQILRQQDSLIAALEEKLRRYGSAQRIAPQLQAHDLAVGRERQAKAALAELSAAVAGLEEQESQAQTILRDTQVAKDEQEEPLLARLEQLKQALKLEQQLAALYRQLDGKQQVERQIGDELRKQQASLQADRERAAELSQELQRLQVERDQNQVDPVLRQQLSAALATSDRHQTVNKQLQELQTELLGRRQQLQAARIKLASLAEASALQRQQQEQRELAIEGLREQAPTVVGSQQLESAQKYLRIAQQLDHEQQQVRQRQHESGELDRAIQRQRTAILASREQLTVATEDLQAATVQVSQCEQELERLRDTDKAALLAEKLQPGQPCPVCGSSSHPEAASPQDSRRLVQAQQQLQSARQQMQSAQEQLARQQAVLSQQEAELARQQAAWEAGAAAEQVAAARVEQQLAGLPIDWIRGGDPKTAVWEQAQANWRRLNQQLAARSQWQQAWEEGNRLLQECTALVDRTRQQLQLQEQAIAAEEREIVRLQSKQASLVAQLAGLEQDLAAQSAGIGQEELGAVHQRYQAMDQQLMSLERKLRQRRAEQGVLEDRLRQAEQQAGELQHRQVQVTTECRLEQANLEQVRAELRALTGGASAAELQRIAEQTLQSLRRQAAVAQVALDKVHAQAVSARHEFTAAQEGFRLASVGLTEARATLTNALQREQFVNRQEAEAALDWAELVPEWRQQIERHRQQASNLQSRQRQLAHELDGQAISEEQWQLLVLQTEQAAAAQEQSVVVLTKAETALSDVEQRHRKWQEYEQQRLQQAHQRDLLGELSSLLRGNALVEFMAGEHLDAIASIATDWLGVLTGQRYALEVAPDGGFLVRDDGNGGERRPVHTLSGGETFITSLALALALSSQVQLRGRYRLEFFFLDEGFGSLDPNLLEVVMSCLERMQGQQMSIGIISHVPELRERIPRQVLVTPAEQGGQGSRVQLSIG